MLFNSGDIIHLPNLKGCKMKTIEMIAWGLFRTLEHKSPKAYFHTLEDAKRFQPNYPGHVIKKMIKHKQIKE